MLVLVYKYFLTFNATNFFMSIKERIEFLKTDLRQEKLDYEEMFQKHLIDVSTYFFHENLQKPNSENKLKSIIAQSFSVKVEEIYIVGSGKIGFSLKPSNLFNEFDNKYSLSKLISDRSDLDIVIISNDLYEAIGKSMYNYTAAYNTKWKKNEYYSIEKAKQFSVPICYKCFEYYTKGWFRPDFKPYGFEFCSNGSFEELKRKMYKIINRKGTIAVYQNWFYFSNYHIANIRNLSLKIKKSTL